MLTHRINEFKNISQRILYGLYFAYSDFEPVVSEFANDEEQKTLHTNMKCLIGKLYDNPALLGLPTNKDEAYDYLVCNNERPELNKIYMAAFKTLHRFFNFLYSMAQCGNIDGDMLVCKISKLKQKKVIIEPSFKDALNTINIMTKKNKDEIVLLHENDNGLVKALQLLAKTRSLFDFICCLYNGNHDYLLQRIDNLYGYNGLLKELKERCDEKGYYNYNFNAEFIPTNLSYGIGFGTGFGGIYIKYYTRKYQQFIFEGPGGRGLKVLLSDFEKHPPRVQKHIIDTCKRCTHCHGCTNGGKIKGGKDQDIIVKYKSELIDICTNFPVAWWYEFNRELMETLLEYNEVRRKYF